MNRFKKHLLALATAAVLVVAATVFVVNRPAHAVPYVSRDQVNYYAYGGLYEKYFLTGVTFYDNDYPDSFEGIDCSAYVSKAYQLPYYLDPMDGYRDPVMYTGRWWDDTVDGAVQVPGWNDGSPPNYWMNVFVWHNSPGSDQHMGLSLWFDYNTGYYHTWEALNPGSGVIVNDRTWQDIESYHAAHRMIRTGWTA